MYWELIRENNDYSCHRGKDVDELVELMVEVMIMPDSGTLRIAGVDKPAAIVKNRFMKINYSHIDYVLFSLHRNTTKIRNIKADRNRRIASASIHVGKLLAKDYNRNF